MANELDLKKIIAPKLNQAGYGANLGQVFDNIDTNFKIIGNKDFVKGDRGFSLKSVQKRLLADVDTFNEDGIKALKSILKLADTSNGSLAGILDDLDDYKVDTIKRIFERKDDNGDYLYPEVAPVSGISMIDYINYSIVFNVIMSYDPENEPNSEKVVGSLNNFSFKDARYVHAKSYSDSEYESRFDFSCLLNLYVKEDSSYDFQTLQNTPTLYYDKNVKCFCWKVSGIETGIIAQGPQGNDGEHARLYVVKVNVNKSSWQSEDNGAYKILSYLDGSQWSTDFPTDWVGSGCVAFGNNVGGNPPYLTFISSIGDGNTVFCSDSNSVHPQITANAIKNGLFLAKYDSDLLAGLFLPIDQYNPDAESGSESRPVHLLWGVPKGSKNLAREELHITPLKNYSSVKQIGNELATLKVAEDLGTSKARLNVLTDKCYNGASIVLDYPEVIIKGYDKNNDGSFLGIGVSYKDKLMIDNKEKYGPRLKLGESGVLEVGTDNNDGLLVVSKILSSLKEQAPLDLESTEKIINLGVRTSPHEVNIYDQLNVFDTIKLLDDDNNERISMLYNIDTTFVKIKGNQSLLYFGDNVQISKLGKEWLEIYSKQEISLQSQRIKIGTEKAGDSEVDTTNVDCFNTQFNMQWNLGATTEKDVCRTMQVGGQFHGLVARLNTLWPLNPTDAPKKQTYNLDGKIDDTVTQKIFSKSIDLKTFGDDGLVDLSKIKSNKQIKISVATNINYYLNGTKSIWDMTRHCNCQVALYRGNERLWESDNAELTKYWDGNIHIWNETSRNHTFDFTVKLPNLKVWVNSLGENVTTIKLKVSTSFWDDINSTGWTGTIQERKVSNRTSSEKINGSISITPGVPGDRMIHSEYLNGAVLLASYKHRNIGIYCDGFEDDPNDTLAIKNSRAGLFMSFLDKGGKPCYTTITARQLFNAVRGHYPEDKEVGTSGSYLYPFDGTTAGGYD